MSIERTVTVGITEVVYETPHRLPNGAVVSKSVLPITQLGFNEWAAQIGVSSSYTESLPPNRAMEQILQWGVKG
jgi:hypothetical protein